MIRGADVTGVIASLVTPLRRGGEVDPGALEQLAGRLPGAGVHAVAVLATAAECRTLLPGERRDVVAAAARVVKGKLPLLAGVEAGSTRELVLLANEAASAGADAVLVGAPAFAPLPDRELVRHFQAAAEGIDCPLVVVSGPRYTGVPVEPGMLARLLGIRNIIAAADRTADMGSLAEALRLAPRGRAVCAGVEAALYPALCAGAAGVLSAAAGIIPGHVVKLHALTAQGKRGEALGQARRLLGLALLLDGPAGPAVAREALATLGLPGGEPRAPLPRADATQKRAVRAALKEAGAL